MTIRPVRRAPAALSSALGMTLMLGAQAAPAAAALIASVPTRYAALIHSPRLIRLHFSEAIVEKSSHVSLSDVTGHRLRLTRIDIHDRSDLEMKVDGRLSEGVYRVRWTSVSAVDGSKASGSYQFTVR